MHRIVNASIAVVFAAAGLMAGTEALAIVAAPAPAVLVPGGTVTVPDFPDGVAVVATKTVPFSSPSGPAGTLTELVVTDSTVNPFGYHDLVFAYSLSLSADDVASVSLPGYGGFGTAVKSCDFAACFFGTGLPPDTATRSADGKIVSFLFTTPLTGTSSAFDVYTDATSFVDPMASIVDSAGRMSFASIFAPATAPEPSTWAMMLLGFAGVGLVIRRRTFVARATA